MLAIATGLAEGCELLPLRVRSLQVETFIQDSLTRISENPRL